MEGVESLERHQPPPLPRNVKVLGWVSFLNDVASEMIFPLLPQFLLTALGGNRFSLGVIEGIVDSVSSLVKLWSGGWSDRIGSRKGLVMVGYALAASHPATDRNHHSTLAASCDSVNGSYRQRNSKSTS